MEEENIQNRKKLEMGSIGIVIIVVGVILLAAVFYNTIRISKMTGNVIDNSNGDSAGGSITPLAASEYLPAGVPDVYGEELKVSYDDVSAESPQKADATITILGNLDRTITLSGENQDRYIKIASLIGCEYCCGSTSVIFKDGSAACGCEHSFAMRGIAKYLIKNHGTEFTDDEILEEMGKWKVLFFPGVHAQKAAALKENGIEINYINLASNKYRGIEKGQASGAGGEMVGGC